MKRALVGAAALLLTACSGLTTPPIDTPHSPFSVTLNQMTGNNYGSSVTLPLMPPIPSFKMPPQAIDVPSNARSVNLASAVLHLRLTNKMQFPLTLQLALSKQTDPYSDPSAALAGKTYTIQPKETKPIDENVDPTLFKQEKLYMGVVFSSQGTSGPVTVSGTDSVDGEAWATVQVKLI